MFPGDVPPRVKKRKPKPEVLPAPPSQTPSFTIPVGALGYGAPSSTYLGRNYSLFTLDFLGENRLLFSLRAPGLLAREASEPTTDRQVKAVVLKLPEGTVESQTVWTLPDRGRYLWALRDGHFLLRDRDGLRIGDASLHIKTLLSFSGEFKSLQIDPEARFIVLHTLEDASPSAPAEVVTRVVQLESGQVQQTTHSQGFDELPVNSDGSLEVVHDKYDQWSLRLTALGGSKVLGHVESTCLPSAAFVSDRVILLTGCDPSRVPKLTAVSTNGQTLWEAETALTFVPPLLITMADGTRFGRESIVLKKAPRPETQIPWVKAVKGQVVRLFDTSTGKVVLEVPVSPTLDGGGNVAISPSGRRVAVLDNGAVKVFDLPAPPQ